MINYPNKKNANFKVNNKKKDSKLSSKGMYFEEMINATNQFYKLTEKALIYKKPTPIKVVKVKIFEKNFVKFHKITDAYYQEKSTTDYNGIYQSYYIDFEAKQTIYNSFNITSNLHKHQLEHLCKVKEQKGIAFLLVYFQKYSKIFLLPIDEIIKFMNNEKKLSLISVSYFEKNGIEIMEGIQPRIDYLKAVDILIKRNEES